MRCNTPLLIVITPKLIAASAHPSSASSQFGSNSTKASRLHPLLAFVFAGLASTLATSTQAHYTLQTLAGTATEKRTEQTASGTNRLQSHSDTESPPRKCSGVATTHHRGGEATLLANSICSQISSC